MSAQEVPAVARRRLRLALRKAREAKGITQGNVAEKLDWSLSKVNRIESGEVTISGTDLRALLSLLEVNDPARIERFTGWAKAARRRGWWDEARYREHLTPGTLQLLQFESEATAIRAFQPVLMPGLLQTRRYAETVMRSQGDELTPDEETTRIEVRVRRQAAVLDRPDPPHYLLILDESVLLREIGGPEVTAEQLQRLQEMVKRPGISIRVMPLKGSPLTAPWMPFTIFDLGDEENAVLYRESQAQDEIIHAADKVTRHRAKFEEMWSVALPMEASHRLVEAKTAEALSSLDRLHTQERLASG